MRLPIFAMLMLYCYAPTVAQTSQQDTVTITCSSHIPAARYFCWQYRMKQAAVWDQRVKQSTDKAEFNLRLDKFANNKVIVRLTVILGGIRHDGTLIVVVDNRHLTASAAKVTEATTAALDLWAKR